MLCAIILILLAIIGMSLSKPPVRTLMLLLFLAISIIWFGFRDGYGTDFYSYLWMFDTVKSHPEYYWVGAESGFRFLIEMLISLNLPNYSLTLISFTLTIVGVTYASSRYSPYVGLSLLILVSFGFLAASLNIVRHALAFSTIVPFLFLLQQKKYKIFSLVVVFASLAFHKAALVLLLLPVFSVLQFKQYFWLVLLIASIILNYFSTYLLSLLLLIFNHSWFPYSHYFESDWLHTSRNNTYLNLVIAIAIAFWIVSRLPMLLKDKFSYAITQSYLLGFCITVVFINFQGINRASFGLTWLIFLVIPFVINSYKYASNKIFTIYGLSAYALVLLAVFIKSHNTNFDIKNYIINIEWLY